MNFGGTTFETAAGLTGYEDAVAAMRARVAGIRAGEMGELVWLVEHPALYTAGTSAKAEDLRDASRFPTFAAGRGGQWTYHGPGQRVGYVMLDLLRAHGRVPARDVRGFVWGLEEWLIRTLAVFGVVGERRADRVGIWVVRGDGREQKIGAIGVRVTRWVSWHGVALNVSPELSHFDGIVPCGIARHGVTSFSDLGVQASMKDVDAVLVKEFSRVFG
jgi:lipoyl(octanoyl) transferase